MVEVRTEHPHIVKATGVCGGSATIRGTRIPVWVLADYARQGTTPEELQELYSHLTLSQIYDALSYWYDHPDEIAEEISANSPPDETAPTRS